MRLVVGADGVVDRGWLAAEVEFLDIRREEDWARFFAPDSIDAILAEHVWNELSPADGRIAVQNCFRYLKPGGYLRLAVPDGLHPEPRYIEWVRPGGIGTGAVAIRSLYTHHTLAAMLRDVGFDVQLLEYYDDSGVLHTAPWSPADGLVRRSVRFDRRKREGIRQYTSLIADARRPLG